MNKQLLSVYNVTELCNLGKYLCLALNETRENAFRLRNILHILPIVEINTSV